MAKAIKNQLPDSNIPQAFYLRTNRKQMKLGHTKSLKIILTIVRLFSSFPCTFKLIKSITFYFH